MHGLNRILYISPFWTGVQPFFTQGKRTFTGMPAFTQVLTELLNRNDCEIHILFFTRKQFELDLHEEWEGRIHVNFIQFPSRTALLMLLPLFVLKIRSYIKRKNIALVYGHGSIGAMGGMAAKWVGVPYVQRIYGTFLINEIAHSKLAMFIRHPLEFLSFWMRANATIITNDGTHGDQVFNRINGDEENLHFMLNGVGKEGVVKYQPDEEARKITYVARIDRWKRQHLLVELAHELKEMGVDDVQFKIIGPTINAAYLKEIDSRIMDHGLQDQVEVVGVLDADEAKRAIATSLLTCSFYHTSNLGNVALESLVAGVPLLAINCLGSMESIPNDVYIEVPEDPKAIALRVKELLEERSNLESVSRRAEAWAEKELLTWKERSNVEIQIIFNHITT